MDKLTMRKFRDCVVNNQIIDLGGQPVNKGVLLSSAGGVLPPAAFREFLNDMTATSPFLSIINTIPVTRPQMELHSLTGSTRQLRAQVPATANTTGTVTPEERVLNPVRGIIVQDVSYDWLEDNADERDADTVIRQHMASLLSWDMTDLAGNGDGTTSGFLATNVSFPVLAAADANVNDYDATNATFLGASGILASMAALMPEQYLPGSAYFMARSEFETLVGELGARATSLGDKVLQDGGPVIVHGHPCYGIYAWPVDKVIMTHPKNLFVGIWHHLRITIKDIPEEGQLRYVITSRFDFQHGMGKKIVYGTTD
jgi:hypothetical protein